MTDLSAMLWKELREFFGNRRNLWMFLVGAVFLGSPKGRKKVVELIRAGEQYPTASERDALFEIR